MKDVWKVYFNGSFGGKSPDGSHPGQVLKLNQKFRFAGRDWYVPAAYLTAKGLVLDILMRADKAALEDFCKKWEHLEDEDVPNDVFEQAERENPLAFEFSPQIELNGQTLPFSQGHGPVCQLFAIGWSPNTAKAILTRPPSAWSSTTTG